VMSNKTRAVIWDMDGVIADTAPYHFKAWQEVFRKRGVTITEDDFKRNFGQRNDRIIRIVLGKDISPDELESVATEKEESFRNRAKNHLKPLPGAVELIKSLREYGFLQALGSSAPPENVRLITRELKIESLFQVIVSGREVKEGKPSPLGFLLAAEKLGVEAKDCIVIEDAIAGVAAARKAGMHCLAVTNTNPRTSLKGAELIVNSLKEVTPGDLESLLDHSN
jgi:beta-phosphoglucomutase family hydrolase